MKLIIEESHSSRALITESENGEKNYYIEGVFMQSGIENRNGRIYPKPVMESQIGDYNSQYVSRKRAMGELGHPENPTVNLERVSHNIVELKYINETDIQGKAKLMDTPYGSIAKAFVREGIELGVSSRGLGTIKESGGKRIVQGNFMLKAIDIVGDPSAPSAFVNGIMEGREWIMEEGVLMERSLSELQSMVNRDTRSSGVAFAESNIFKNFDRILANAEKLKSR